MAKEFKNITNPALKFITGAEDVETNTPEPVKPLKVKETKSKRFNLLIYPSIHDACKRKADEQGESVNEVINEILREYFSDKE